jgi:hypothetical protein
MLFYIIDMLPPPDMIIRLQALFGLVLVLVLVLVLEGVEMVQKRVGIEESVLSRVLS